MNNDIKKKRGGGRPGAGRKPLPPEEQKVPIGYKIAPEAAQALDDLAERWGCSKRVALERALLAALERALEKTEKYNRKLLDK